MSRLASLLTPPQPASAEQVLAAIKESSEVSKLNIPAQIFNAEARRKNDTLKKLIDELHPELQPKKRNALYYWPNVVGLKPLQQASENTRRILAAEAAIRLQLSRRLPKTWLAILNCLPVHERAEIACIIWWDFFADYISAERVTEFDKFLFLPPSNFSLSRVRIEAALIACGYTPHQAYRRAAGVDDTPESVTSLPEQNAQNQNPETP